MKFTRVFTLALGLMLSQIQAHAQQNYQKGTVALVRSGDTLTINTEEGQVHVRLAGVASPFMCQSDGKKSREILNEFALGRPAHFVVIGKERDRLIGQVIINGRDTATHLLQKGSLWFNERDNPIMQVTQVSLYTTLWKYAQKSKLGIYAADAAPVPPWEYAKKYGRCDL